MLAFKKNLFKFVVCSISICVKKILLKEWNKL